MAKELSLTHDDFMENAEYEALCEAYGEKEAKKILSQIDDTDLDMSEEEILGEE